MLLLLTQRRHDDSDDDDDDYDDVDRELEWGLKFHQCSTCSAALLTTPVPFDTFLNPEEGPSLCHSSLGKRRERLSLYNLHKDSSCA